MTKKNTIIFIIFLLISSLVFGQNEKEVMKEAFTRFSKSPFTSIYSSGGAFYSGDDLDQMPMLVNYYKNSNNTVMVHIRHLREKMSGPTGKSDFIKTVWGVGYKVEE